MKYETQINMLGHCDTHTPPAINMCPSANESQKKYFNGQIYTAYTPSLCYMLILPCNTYRGIRKLEEKATQTTFRTELPSSNTSLNSTISRMKPDTQSLLLDMTTGSE